MLARPNSSDECPHSRPICSLELDMKTTALLLLKAFDMCFYMDYNVTIWASTQYAVGWPSESSCNVADLTSHEWTMTSCTWCRCVIKLSHLLSRRAFWTMTWSPNAAVLAGANEREYEEQSCLANAFQCFLFSLRNCLTRRNSYHSHLLLVSIYIALPCVCQAEMSLLCIRIPNMSNNNERSIIDAHENLL